MYMPGQILLQIRYKTYQEEFLNHSEYNVSLKYDPDPNFGELRLKRRDRDTLFGLMGE